MPNKELFYSILVVYHRGQFTEKKKKKAMGVTFRAIPRFL